MTLDRLDDSLQPLPVPDVQRTTLSLDLMGRFVCNTWDEAVNNGGAPFDVVIIGSGMFGGYCADHIFRNSGLRVLVLDAGPFLVSTHLQNLPGIGLFAPNPIDPAIDPGTAPTWSGEIRCRFIFWGKNDELTPDFAPGFPPRSLPHPVGRCDDGRSSKTSPRPSVAR